MTSHDISPPPAHFTTTLRCAALRTLRLRRQIPPSYRVRSHHCCGNPPLSALNIFLLIGRDAFAKKANTKASRSRHWFTSFHPDARKRLSASHSNPSARSNRSFSTSHRWRDHAVTENSENLPFVPSCRPVSPLTQNTAPKCAFRLCEPSGAWRDLESPH